MTIGNDNDIIGLALGIISLIGVVFAVYKSYHKPQEDLELKQAVVDKEMDSKASILAQKEMENKANLLAQQVEAEKCANEKRFAEFANRLDQAFALAQNHIHTVDTKVDGLATQIGTMSNAITKLSTIIDERIPKK